MEAYAPPPQGYAPPPEGYAYPPAAAAAPGYPAAGYAAAPPGYPPAEAYGYAATAAAAPGYAAPAVSYGAPPPSYGYAAPPPSYGAPGAPGAPGYPPPESYGYAPPPGYAAPPGYPYGAVPGAAPPPGYGAATPGYGALDRALSENDSRRSRKSENKRPAPAGRVDSKEGKGGKSGKGDRGKGKSKDKKQKDDKESASSKTSGKGVGKEPGKHQADPPKVQVNAEEKEGEEGKGKGKSKDGKGGKGKKGDGKGKGKGKGKVAMKIAWGEPCFVGRLRNYDIEKKAGIISCAEAYNLCGMETCAFGSVLEPQGVGVGDTLVFFIHWSSWGRPQASYELLRIHAINGMALKGKFKKAGDASGEKDFGFIECAEAKEYFGKDVYVNRELAAGLETGQWVSFNVKLNRDMMPNVTEIAQVDEAWTPVPGDLSENKEAEDVPPSWEFSAILGITMGSRRGSSTPKPTGEFFTAEFKAWNEERNFGFVGSDELKARFGNDVFVHNRELSNFPVKAVGEKIYFELGVTEDGKPQVLNAQPVTGEPPLKKARTEEPPSMADAGSTSASSEVASEAMPAASA